MRSIPFCTLRNLLSQILRIIRRSIDDRVSESRIHRESSICPDRPKDDIIDEEIRKASLLTTRSLIDQDIISHPPEDISRDPTSSDDESLHHSSGSRIDDPHPEESADPTHTEDRIRNLLSTRNVPLDRESREICGDDESIMSIDDEVKIP